MSGVAPAAAQPLLLIGARRRAALHDTLVACAQSWRKEWSAATDPVRILLAEEVENTNSRGTQVTCLSMRSAAHGKLACVSAELDALPGLLGVAPHADRGACGAHNIAREFEGEMLRALCATLARRARIEDMTVESASSAERPDRRARTLPVTIHIGTSRPKVSLLLTAQFLELLVPPQSATRSSSAMTRRRHAVAQEAVRVEAVLGEAEVSLRDLAQLAFGDVIVLEQPLRAGGRLTMPDGASVATFALGRSNDRRAISISKRS